MPIAYSLLPDECLKSNVLDFSFDTLVDLVPNIEPEILKQKSQEKLGWLINYQEELKNWQKMVYSTRNTETQLKLNGLNKKSLTILQELLFKVNSPEPFQQKIINYLRIESDKINSSQTLLATTLRATKVYRYY